MSGFPCRLASSLARSHNFRTRKGQNLVPDVVAQANIPAIVLADMKPQSIRPHHHTYAHVTIPSSMPSKKLGVGRSLAKVWLQAVPKASRASD